MILREALSKGEAFLREKGVRDPRLSAQLIFSAILQMARIELYTHDDKPLTSAEILSLRAALIRRAAGEPVAYVTGKKQFFGREFRVTGSVLIPRPETEELITHALHLANFRPGDSVADFGTGSGCIAITLSLEWDTGVHAIDVSESAIALARENTELLNANVNFRAADILSGDMPEKFDIIVSNPPYITPDEFSGLDTQVADFEPRAALLAKESDQLIFLKKITDSLSAHGRYFVETNPSLAESQSLWLNRSTDTTARILRDIAGRPHFLYGVKNENS